MAPIRVYLGNMALMVRILLFEKLSIVFMAGWWSLIMVLTMIVGSVSIWIGIAVVMVGMVLCRLFKPMVVAQKHVMIRRGDRVEYAVPEAAGTVQRFERAAILRPMTPENVAKTARFEKDHLELFDHFFLVDTGKANRVIPADWIVAIEPEGLD